MQWQIVKLTKIMGFKYLGPAFQSNRKHVQKVKKGVLARWNDKRRVTGVIRD